MAEKIISIGCDHAGVEHKAQITAHLIEQGWTVINHGTDKTDSVDYPDYAHPVAQDVEEQKATFGVLICGSANGVCMTANKHQGIRAALCWQTEIATLARQHNDANVICLPARFADIPLCIDMVNAFVQTEFEGGRHANRVGKIACQA
ncbi:MAG: ribose 5-phosphate isomerase B [Bacteroidetes bacterium]|jgi:ribose 5-phosphate isomerase B|nr:ribose 5-phosphate isomerase B [Bacteroidota bacterium]